MGPRAVDQADPALLWERAIAASAAGRAAALLRAMGVDPAGVPLGLGLRHLLGLRAALVGQSLEGYAVCPDCGAEKTVVIGHAELVGARLWQEPEIGLLLQGIEIRLRLPTPADLAEAGEAASVADALAGLRRSVLLSACRDGKNVPGDALPDEAWAEIEATLDAADGLADVRLALSCEDCAAAWSLALDLPDFLTRELGLLARRRLAEVVELAAVFGWSEREIFDLAPARRRLYLDLARDREAQRGFAGVRQLR